MRGTSSLPKVLYWLILLTLLCSFPVSVAAQDTVSAQASTGVSATPLISQPVDEHQLTILKGNVHPLARPQFDLGTAPASLPMQRMLLVLKRSPQQESALRKLLDDQQDKHSPNYHKWLTPEQYGKQFGPSDSDMQAITGWLQSHGFQLGAPSKGRTVVEFSGSTSQVQEAFHTAIHKYVVKGEQHWANASDPQIPTALTNAIAGVDSFNNFGRKSMSRFVGVARRDKVTGKVTVPHPQFTFPVSSQNACNAQDTNCYVVGPYDFATIYNVLPLWNTGIDGTGQNIAIVQDSNINVADVEAFRSIFSLPINDPNVVLDGPDPGVLNPGQFGAESEADLDVQWSGAVAKGATIDLVVSADTDTTAGTDLSALYAIENNQDGIMSESFGACEPFLTNAGNQFYNGLWEQAAAQGISVFVSSGDQGSAGCDVFEGSVPQPALNGLAVNGIASTPFNVAVGGTDFDDLFNPESYWNVTNDATQASALGYIPETTWNNSCANALFASAQGGSGDPETNCNNPSFVDFVTTGAGSGGPSNCQDSTTVGGLINCVSGYPKPAWQTGATIPPDGVRDLPDVSLFASNGFVGNFYVFCQSDITASGTCDLSAPYEDFGGVGGTSASSPAMAGIMALVNQMTGSRQGNPNYVLYKLATQVPAAFNDVANGTIRVPCEANTLDCTTLNTADTFGIINGYDAAAGYDLATGLGSVNANILVTNWSSVTFTPSTTALLLNGATTAVTLVHGTPVAVQINVTPTTGTGTPTGDVSLVNAGVGPGIDGFTLSAGVVTSQTSLLPGGSYSVKAHYAGDSTFGASDSTAIPVTVTPESSTVRLSILTASPSGGGTPFSSGPFGSFVYLRADVIGASQEGFPSGTVTFTDSFGGIPGGTNSFQLNSEGNASAANGIVNFDAGTHTIAAAYSGDASFGASSTAQPQTFTITPGFYLATAPADVTISSPGSSGTTTVGIVASTGLGTVNFTCSGLPAEATCSAASVTGGGPNTVATATITVTTTAAHTTQLFNHREYYLARMLTGGGFLFAGILLIGSPRTRKRGILLSVMVLSLLIMLPACGGGSSSQQVVHQQDPGTPTGTYSITVTGTSGAITQSTGFSLVVN